jgi:hypothetical protein
VIAKIGHTEEQLATLYGLLEKELHALRSAVARDGGA